MPADPTSLFEPIGTAAIGFLPTDYARGPWDPAHLHGGPVSALVARAVEQVPGAGAFAVARLTIELLRPVPVEPLLVEAEVPRPGRKIQLVEVTIRHEASGTVLVRARALLVRTAEMRYPADGPEVAITFPDDVPALAPHEARLERPAMDAVGTYRAFHSEATEHRFLAGGWSQPGPVTVWIRLVVPVVPGEPPTSLQRVAAAADFGNGVSAGLPWDRYLFINPELSIHLHRALEGEWVGLRVRSHYGSNGVGLAAADLFDVSGSVGRSAQSLLVDDR